MSEDYVGAFNSTTQDIWRDPGAYTGTYIALLGTVAFFPVLWIVYLIWNRLFRLFRHCCCVSKKEDPWLTRTRQNFLKWFNPFSLILHFCTSLASACFFIYLVVHINDLYDAKKPREDLVQVFKKGYVVWLEFGLCFIDVLYVISRFFSMQRKLDIFFSLDDILTILVSVSGIAAPFLGFYYWGFMSLRFAQLASVLGTAGKMHWKFFSGLLAQMVVMIAFFFALVFAITGLVFTYENVYFTGGLLTNYFVAIYMTGITLTTVGYGDFYPVSRAGRIVIILGVLAAFWMVPPLIAAVLEPWRKFRAHRTYSGDSHAIILSRSDQVQTVVSQFYRARKTVAENLLLMTESEGSVELKTFLRSEFLRLRVTHFVGDWSDPHVVKRAAPTKAHCCLLVQDKFTDDTETSDADMIAGALSLLRVSKSVPMFIQLNSVARRFTFSYNRDNILCMDDLRRGLLAQNCTAPGILSVLSNLVIAKAGPARKYKHHWLANYKTGLFGHFETDIELDQVATHSWANVAKALLALHSIICLSVWNRDQGLMLFPLQYVIAEGDVGQFITTGNKKQISDALASEPFQKYLIMLKASVQIDGVDHMKALSLADMVESEDAEIVQKFNLFQRSNLSDLLARSASSRSSADHSRRSVSEKGKESDKLSPRTSPVPGHDQAAGSSRASPRTAQDTKSKVDDPNSEGEKPKSRRPSASSRGSIEGSRRYQSASEHEGSGPGDDEEGKKRKGSTSLPLEQIDIAASRKSGESQVSGTFRSVTPDGPQPSALTGDDPFIPTLVEPSLMISQDNIALVEDIVVWDQSVAKRRSLEKLRKKHIVVFGRADEMTTSIGRRLLRRTPDQQNIVLVVSHVSSASQKVVDQLSQLSAVPRVDVLIGSPVNPSDLTRAAAPEARVCLILPDAQNLKSSQVQAAQDSNMLITYHLLKQTDAFPIIELMNPDNEQLMMTEDDGGANLGTAGGNIFKRTLFDNIMTQAVFKKHFIPLFESLSDATISHLSVKKIWDAVVEGSPNPDTVLFGQVFTYVLEQKSCLPIAVFRKRRAAEEYWEQKKVAKAHRVSSAFPFQAAMAFRGVKGVAKGNKLKNSGQPETEDRGLERRFTINAPHLDLEMMRSDIIFVIEYDRDRQDPTATHSRRNSWDRSTNSLGFRPTC